MVNNISGTNPKSLEEVIDQCDSMREFHEGVGLSDTLVDCVELAYQQGVHSVAAPFYQMEEGDVLKVNLNNQTYIKLTVTERSTEDEPRTVSRKRRPKLRLL